MNIVFMQTSDPKFYYPMLQETAKTVMPYCEANGIQYMQYIGIKSGNMPWKSTYNRIFMLKELLDSGFRGWAFYLDADCYITDMQFDIEGYLEDKGNLAGIFSGHLEGVPHRINAGGFAINLNHPIGRQLVLDYYRSFDEIGAREFSKAVYWDGDIPEDQWMLHSILERYVTSDQLFSYFLFEFPNKSYVNNGPFITQLLRSKDMTFSDRLSSIKSGVRSVILGQNLPPDVRDDPGIAYLYASHPNLLTNIGQKSGASISNSGMEEGFLLYGPYITLDQGTYTLKIYGKVMELEAAARHSFKCDVCIDSGRTIVADVEYPIRSKGNFIVEMPFQLEQVANELETRLYVRPGVRARLFAIKIEKRRAA